MFWDCYTSLCKLSGLSPNAVAKQIGVSNATCTKWKNGTIPNGETLITISDFFDCSVDYLLGNTDSPQSSKSREDPQTAEAMELYKALTDENRELVLQMMKGLLKK